MRIWMVGFATRSSAVRATKTGAVAAFLAAAREVAALFTTTSSDRGSFDSLWLATGVVLIVMVVAGVRLFEGNGRFSGIVASMFMAIEIAILSLVPLSPFTVGGLLATVALFSLTANGVRGAFALRFFDGVGLRKVFD